MVSRTSVWRKRRTWAAVAVLLAGASGVGLYSARKPLAQGWIDRALKQRGVTARYRLTQLDPDRQRLEHVVIGDPAHPELTADWVETQTRLGWFSATLTGVRASGVRVYGRVDRAGAVHLGQLDQLVGGDAGNGPFKWPDLVLELNDARATLATSVGVVAARLDGSGNPTQRFDGLVRALWDPHAIAPLAAHRVYAVAPLSIRAGAADVAARLVTTDVDYAGTTVAAPDLLVRATIAPDMGSAHGTLSMTSPRIASPLIAKLAHALDAGHATPLAPFAAQFAANVATLGNGVQADARFTADRQTGLELGALSAHNSAGVRAHGDLATWVRFGQSGFAWAAHRVTIDNFGFAGSHVALSGSASKVKGTATLPPLRAPNTQLVLAPITFSHGPHGTHIETAARFDGTVAGVIIAGAALPIAGVIDPAGHVRLDHPCTPVRADSVRLPRLSLGRTAITACLRGDDLSIPQPRLAGVTSGQAFDVTANALHYSLARKVARLDTAQGHYGPAQLSVAQARYALATQRFEAITLHAAVGAAGHASTLTIDAVKGALAGRVLRGDYRNGAGVIANVPLILDQSAGSWTVADGALTLNGGLHVADATPAPNARFEPLVVPDVLLHYANGTVQATGTLREPKSGAFVSRVSVTHSIASQTGDARLTIHQMPLLRFDKALQPDQLTSFTKGLIANVKGAISGEARIRWSPRGITSDGDFETDHIDLAALFGVANRLSGKVHFTDLLGRVTAPHQELRIASVNPGIIVNDGVVHYQLRPDNRLAIEDGHFPFADGRLSLEPTVLDLNVAATRRLTFRVEGVDAAKFITQSGFEDIAATGVFDGRLPLIFDAAGGRIEGGTLAVRAAGGTVSYVGPVSNAALGRFGQLAFDALKAIRYHGLTIDLNGPLDGEMITLIKLSGTNESLKSAKKSYLLRQITGIPFKFNIRISAPFRSLFNTAKTLDDPSALVQQDLPANLKASAAPKTPPGVHPPASPVQPKESDPVR